MIRLQGIEKFYSSGVVKTFVVRRVNLEIREGEFVSIMGPSGAGKSTLLYKKAKGSERKSLVCRMLDRFQMVAKKDLFPHQLSGGEQQLVGIARALIVSPKLILADEPTGNLNSRQGQEIMETLKKLNEEGTTIVQVTHSEKNAAYGQRIINMVDGWIEEGK